MIQSILLLVQLTTIQTELSVHTLNSAKESFSQQILTGNQTKISKIDRMVGSIPLQPVREKVQLDVECTSYSMVAVVVHNSLDTLDIMTSLQQTISSWYTQI